MHDINMKFRSDPNSDQPCWQQPWMAAYGSNTGGIPVMASARPKGAKISASCGRVGTCRYLLLASLIYVYHDTDSMPPHYYYYYSLLTTGIITTVDYLYPHFCSSSLFSPLAISSPVLLPSIHTDGALQLHRYSSCRSRLSP